MSGLPEKAPFLLQKCGFSGGKKRRNQDGFFNIFTKFFSLKICENVFELGFKFRKTVLIVFSVICLI